MYVRVHAYVCMYEWVYCVCKEVCSYAPVCVCVCRCLKVCLGLFEGMSLCLGVCKS